MNVELLPKRRVSRGAIWVLMVVIGVNNSQMYVGGEGRNELNLADWSDWVAMISMCAPRVRGMRESNPFESIGLEQVIDRS